MKKIYFLLLPIVLSLSSCGQIFGPETTSKEWIAIIDIDGSNLEYICESEGAIPYYVPDIENPGEELILIDYSNRVYLMNLDGTDRRTVIDSVGSIFSFSQDKTKMLLNNEGEIYIANVDGTEFQNLTNTPDIWEWDPSFSPDAEKIVFTYRLNDDTHAFLVIKDLTTNQNSIVYEYNTGEYTKRINFRYPAFQNADQILYRFNLKDQTEEPYIYRYELHRININTNINEIIFNDTKVFNFVYNHFVNICAMLTEYAIVLFNMNSLLIDNEFVDTGYSDLCRFSPNANYLSIGTLIYRLINDVEYYVDTEENDFNQTETKIVGVTNRSYPEERD